MKNSHCERCSLTFLRRQLPPRPQPWLPELSTTGLQQGLRKAGPLPGIPKATCFAPWVTFMVNALTPVTTGPLCTDLRVCWQHLATCKTRGDFKGNQSKAARAQDLIICCFVPMVGSIIKPMVCPNISRLVNLVNFVPIQQVLVISFGFLMTGCVLVTWMTPEMRSLAKVDFDLRHWRGIEQLVRRYRRRMMCNKWWMC